jgi:hypothetical protein
VDVNLQPFLFSAPHIAAASFLCPFPHWKRLPGSPNINSHRRERFIYIPSRYSCICQLLHTFSPRMQRQHVHWVYVQPVRYDYFGVDSDEMLTYCFKPVHTFRNDGGGRRRPRPVITQRGLIKAERGTDRPTDGPNSAACIDSHVGREIIFAQLVL